MAEVGKKNAEDTKPHKDGAEQAKEIGESIETVKSINAMVKVLKTVNREKTTTEHSPWGFLVVLSSFYDFALEY